MSEKEKGVRTGEIITVTVLCDGKKEVKEYECKNFLEVRVNDIVVSTNAVLGIDRSKPLVWRS